MPQVHIVVKTVGGYAREDASVPDVVGAYSDAIVAEKVRKLSGCDAKVVSVNLDSVPPGVLAFAKEIGITL